MTEIYITRHGETEWNIEGRFQGRGNSELTLQGIAQAKSLGQTLDDKKIELIITSPLKRAQETAKLARGDRDIPIVVLDSLSELDLGTWEGAYLRQLEVTEKENYYKYWNEPFEYKPNGGESYRELIARIREAMTSVFHIAKGRRVLIITHGMALMAVLHVITGTDFNEIIKKRVLKQASITKTLAEEVDGEIRYTVEYIGEYWRPVID